MPATARRLHGVRASLNELSIEVYTDNVRRCLHHTKEANKIRNLQAAYRKKEAETPRDSAPSAGQIRSLGLLDRRDEEVDIKKPGTIPALTDNRGRPEGQKPIVH